MNPIDLLHSHKDAFTKSELEIYRCIIKEPYLVIRGTIDYIAKKAKTSKAAVVRLCKKIGYEGYAEFRFEMSRYLLSTNKENENSELKDDLISITDRYAEYTKLMRDTTSLSVFNEVAKKLVTTNKIKIYGYNRTGFSALQFRYRAAKLGLDCEAVTDLVVMQDTVFSLNKNDVCFLITISGETVDYANIVSNLKEKNVTIIMMTMNPNNPLKDYCDHIIYLPYISRSSGDSFLDDQPIMFIAVEVLLSQIASLTK